MQVEVSFDGEGRYSITHEGQVVAPGTAPLPPPPVFFLGSVAACAGVFAVAYLKARHLPFAGLSVIAEAGYAESPRRLADLKVELLLPADVGEQHTVLVKRAVDFCTLKNTLTHAPSINVEITSPATVN
jgi:ribosomal protein S12 methylthiotransferase accessory factor